MKRLIQLLPSHHSNDATGAEALVVEKLMRSFGWEVQTYAEFIDPELQGSTKPFNELDVSDIQNAVAFYYFTVCSDITFRFIELDCLKVVRFQNVTPPEFFRPYDIGLTGVCEESLRQAHILAEHADIGIGTSDFNSREFGQMGCRRTRTVPFFFDPERYSVEPDEHMLNKLSDKPIVLFVGRLAPNKAPDDFIRVAAAYNELSEAPPARFVIAGKRNVLPAYDEEIDGLVEKHGLSDDQLLITGEISQAELVACYRSAKLFLSLSRHEGFCVPLLESMLFDVPVLALARTAVPETLGDAGLLFDTTDPGKIAMMVRDLLADETMRADLVRLGREQLCRYNLQQWGFVLKVLLEGL